MASMTVPVRMRIPRRTKARIWAAQMLAQLRLVALARRVVSPLRYDVQIGSGPWVAQYADVEIPDGADE